MERNEERLNELTLLIVDSGALRSPLFVPSKIEKRYSNLAVCPAGQPAERGARCWREKVLCMIKDLKKKKKKCYKHYTVICFDNESSDYLFQL